MSHRNGFALAAVLAALLVLVLVSGGLALAHMGQDSTHPAPKVLTQPSWKLASFTFDGQPQILVPGVSITLSFRTQPQQVSGFNGCNAYGAAYSVSQDQLHLGELQQTLVGCLKPGVSEQETHYMTALTQITTYHLDQSGLTLRDNTGKYVLHYTAATS